MLKNIILTMSILTALCGCKSQENTHSGNADSGNADNNAGKSKTEAVMPQGRLLEVTYRYSGSYLPDYGDFELSRTSEDGGGKFKFHHFSEEMTFEVSDTLFDAVRRIIEEEKMYQYVFSYINPMNHKILDGYAWDFSATFENKERLISYGSNSSPDGNGLNRLERLLSETAAQMMEEKNKEQEDK